jgi:L-aminopeptidase/D-esterase-like protein
MTIRPGPRNLITDVPGIAVGNAEDRRAWTGVTVVLPDRAVVAAVDVRGGGPGTRETTAMDASSGVPAVAAWRSDRRACRSCRPRSCSTC